MYLYRLAGGDGSRHLRHAKSNQFTAMELDSWYERK